MKTLEKIDSMHALALWAGVACIVKFLLDGVVLSIAGHHFNFGHTDPLAYGALLTPILAAHGYIHTRKPKKEGANENPN